MGVFVGVGDELLVDLVGDIGLPVVGEAGQADACEKERGEEDGGGEGFEAAAAPALGAGGRGARRKRELQRVLGGATGDALHAGGAFGGADLDEAVDGKILGQALAHLPQSMQLC